MECYIGPSFDSLHILLETLYWWSIFNLWLLGFSGWISSTCCWWVKENKNLLFKQSFWCFRKQRKEVIFWWWTFCFFLVSIPPLWLVFWLRFSPTPVGYVKFFVAFLFLLVFLIRGFCFLYHLPLQYWSSIFWNFRIKFSVVAAYYIIDS